MTNEGIRALLIEDNPGDVRLIRELFGEIGGASIDLECADRLSVGLERLLDGGIDVVLLDLGLPDTQGLDTFIKAKAQAPGVPIVVLTGLKDDGVAAQAVREGAQDYLVKGQVSGELLARAMRYAIERKRGEQALREYSNRLEQMVAERTRDLLDAQEELVRREKLALLGELAASLAHELRHPLGVISNAVYYLQNVIPAASEPVEEYLGIISSEVGGAEIIISNLLEYGLPSPPDRGEATVLELMSDVLERQPAPEEIEVVLSIPSDLPPIYVDSRQMRRALSHLVTNAYQAMPEGGKLTIKTSEVSGAPARSNEVAISITDTGVGLSQENVEKLFQPLFTTKARGMGLGLPVCKRLVEANGGRMEVQSKEGKGSTFTVVLPFKGPT